MNYMEGTYVDKERFNEVLAKVSNKYSVGSDADALAIVLMAVWETVEHAPVTISKVATFYDMASVVLSLGKAGLE